MTITPIAQAIRTHWPALDHNTRQSLAALDAGMLRTTAPQRIAAAAQPMYAMFEALLSGEVDAIDGRAVMLMPDGIVTRYGEYVVIEFAINGWIDCLQRIDPTLQFPNLAKLSRRLAADIQLTPTLINAARDEFTTSLKTLEPMRPSEIKSLMLTADISWALESAGIIDERKAA